MGAVTVSASSPHPAQQVGEARESPRELQPTNQLRLQEQVQEKPLKAMFNMLLSSAFQALLAPLGSALLLAGSAARLASSPRILSTGYPVPPWWQKGLGSVLLCGNAS